ncbi:4-hydroxybutyrate CoA-transferase [Pelosinus propionicus DSM 13327]|uniref:4-hydroxybutyrate CoA-transferase n=2 Tax=Pelosinus TaxID=365348 RepID=A0A1I4IJG4_9FIRM|nr:4-hydroxybutyrate CoA-transferase [Pelosinus propionicus DSM 13327]
MSMKEWQTTYRHKLVSAFEAVQKIKSGDRVVVGHACGEPQALVYALTERYHELCDVEITHMVAMGNSPYAQPGMENSFRHNALFVGRSTRQAIAEGRADYTPCFFSEIPRLFKEKILPVQVVLLQITPPDEQGFCSYGISADYTVAAAQSADIVIAQVNRRLPRTQGAKIHLNHVDYLVEQDEEIVELLPGKIGEVERRIGRQIAEMVPDGATLQLGIGAIPDAVLLFLQGKKDLGIHSEMFSDGVVDLVNAGVITNCRKSQNPNVFVATFLMGTRKLYDFIDQNPQVQLHPADYVNDPYIIGKHELMISINSALQVDLMGQVNAEMIGSNQFSGIGGQVDFIRGASRSLGGKSIIALPTTAAKGTVSRIVAELDQGSAVSTSRNDVQYVVTEYGAVDLRGKTLRQRAAAMIEIAHPDFRPNLREQAKMKGLL